MPEYRFTPRQIIFQEGDPADHAFVLREGEVEILKHGSNGEIKLATLKAGDVFGEMALFELNGTRSATARAMSDALADVLDQNEFSSLLQQCPPRILPIIQAVLGRLRSSNARLSQSEQASVILNSDIEKSILRPASDALSFPEMEALTARLPFVIGGYGAEGPNQKNRQNHLNLPSTGSPMVISRQHCQIELIDGALFLTDLGSRHTTVVNGVSIGRGKGKYRLPLKKGENEIILGGLESPYKILIICE